MNEGDRVRLVKSLGLFEAGSEGVVDSITSRGSVNVSLDKDSAGNAITPPAIMPPVTPDYYQNI